jgi:hypothetical protein
MNTFDDIAPLLDEDDRRHVWWRIIDQVDDALDIEGLPATDRGTLVALRQQARERLVPEVAYVPDYVPVSWSRTSGEAEPERSPWWPHRDELEAWLHRNPEYRIHWDTEKGLRAHGMTTFAQIVAMSDGELLALHGVGPARVRELRAACDAWRRATQSGVTA